jgi:cytochrome c-type biogenesis protein CcmH/NrfF
MQPYLSVLATQPIPRLYEDTDTDRHAVPVVDGDDPKKPDASGKAALSDGLALSISGAVGSVAGLISWLIAARIMPQEAVGYASAFVSAFLLVAGTAQLNLDAGNMIWLPKAGRKAGTLFWRSHAVIVPACVAVALGYVAVVPTLAETGSSPTWPFAVGVVLFVVASAGWGLWGLHDYTLVAVGKPWWAAGRSIGFAVARIALLVALGASMGPLGIVLSWVVPIALWTIGTAVVAGYFTRRFSRITNDGWLPPRNEVVSFLAPTTIAHWGTVLLFNQVTVLVIQRFGPGAGAAFFVAWQAVMVVDVAAQRFMQSLSAQIARDPEHAQEHIDASRRRLYMIFVPLVAVGILVAGFALQIFGPGYAQAADVLRLLFIGMIPRLLISHELGVRQALNEGMGFARLQLASTLLVIAVVVLVPITPADPSGVYQVGELWPLAIGYTVSQALCALWVVFTARRRRHRREQVRAEAKAASAAAARA